MVVLFSVGICKIEVRYCPRAETCATRQRVARKGLLPQTPKTGVSGRSPLRSTL